MSNFFDFIIQWKMKKKIQILTPLVSEPNPNSGSEEKSKPYPIFFPNYITRPVSDFPLYYASQYQGFLLLVFVDLSRILWYQFGDGSLEISSKLRTSSASSSATLYLLRSSKFQLISSASFNLHLFLTALLAAIRCIAPVQEDVVVV